MELHKAAQQWVGIMNGELVCHTGVVQFPMRKGWKRIHRLVVLPDYQGVGIGTKFVEEIAKHYKENGWNVNLTTTTPALVHALVKNEVWLLKSYGRLGNSMKSWNKYYGKQYVESWGRKLKTSSSKKRITYSFNYKQNRGDEVR